MKPIILIGARLDGQAGVVLDLIEQTKEYKVVGYIDNTPSLQNKLINGVPVLGLSDDLEKMELETDLFHISIGDNPGRGYIFNRLMKLGYKVVNLIHPHAIVSKNIKIGQGCYIGPGAIVNYNSQIENAVIINSGAIIEHDNKIGFCAHVAPGAKTAGRVSIGEYSFVGLGATILPDINIGRSVMVGAGSTVIRNISDKTTVRGYAAKPMQGIVNIYKDIKPDNP